ncbi:MAG: hypothetical protein HF982_13275 [Desulfobacteraceae bacterium]|nr:hypothetical protein [Desulfobacteraceae bacterium]MBC2720531.1 hypothetical protein [Desulfobacteraceae bacterium]
MDGLSKKEVAAAYLFGSAVINAPVVNDLDILLLVYPDIDKNIAYFDLSITKNQTYHIKTKKTIR